jgi:hypothetical protein
MGQHRKRDREHHHQPITASTVASQSAGLRAIDALPITGESRRSSAESFLVIGSATLPVVPAARLSRARDERRS